MSEIILGHPDQFGVRQITWTEGGRRCAACFRRLLDAWRCLTALRRGDRSLLRY